MSNNPILDELHETRKRLLAQAGGTLDALVDQLQRDERLSKREFVHPKAETNKSAAASEPDSQGTGTQSLPVGDQ